MNGAIHEYANARARVRVCGQICIRHHSFVISIINSGSCSGSILIKALCQLAHWIAIFNRIWTILEARSTHSTRPALVRCSNRFGFAIIKYAHEAIVKLIRLPANLQNRSDQPDMGQCSGCAKLICSRTCINYQGPNKSIAAMLVGGASFHSLVSWW